MTKQIKKILVPIDGSKNSRRGLEIAISLAKQCNASLTGLISIETVSHSELKGMVPVSDEVRAEVEKIMHESKNLAAKNGVNLKTKIMEGNVGYNIIKVAHSAEKFSLIVIGSRGRGAIKKMFFGSTSNYVIHTAKIPVMIVK